jgi:hypothetical protein
MGALYWFYADRSHLAAMDYDLYFLFYQNSEGKTADLVDSTDNRIMLGRYNMKEEIDNPYPVTIYASGRLDALQYTGLPVVRSGGGYLVMSKRMLELLLAIKPFARRATPVIIADDTEREKFYPDRKLMPGVRANTDYVLVKPLRHYRLDREKWQENKKKLALLTDDEVIDPVFKVAEACSSCFITAQARSLLEREGIKGIKYVDDLLPCMD